MAFDWQLPPYSALCTLEWERAGTVGKAVGWLHSSTRLVTAGHVIADIGNSTPTIKSAFGNVQCGTLHDTHYVASADPPAGPSDYGVIEVSNTPTGCTFLSLVVPSKTYAGPCYLLAYDFTQQAVVFNDGEIALLSDVRFLHTADGSPSYSGGAIIIKTQPVGVAAIGIYTDDSRSYALLQSDPGGGLAPRGPQYGVATSLVPAVQSQIDGASA